MSEVASLIKEYMAKQEMTQKELADHFGYSSSQFVSNVTRGLSSWPLDKAKKLCEILKIPPGKFIWAYGKDLENEMKLKLAMYKRELLR